MVVQLQIIQYYKKIGQANIDKIPIQKKFILFLKVFTKNFFQLETINLVN